MSGELLLVGSIPLDTPQDVFQTFGAPLGRYLFAMPDGEVGPRLGKGQHKRNAYVARAAHDSNTGGLRTGWTGRRRFGRCDIQYSIGSLFADAQYSSKLAPPAPARS